MDFRTQALTWQTAINNNAQWAIILTWNDHYEGHALRPNATAQYSFYDLTAYYISWFKTGVQPTIVRDVLYYSHRMHLSNLAPNSSYQPTPMVSANGRPFVDNVYLLGFLAAPGTLQITSGGAPYTQAFSAGVHTLTAPLSPPDIPEFALIRSGSTVLSVPSAFTTRNSILWQDLAYRGGSSSRPAAPGLMNNLPQDRIGW